MSAPIAAAVLAVAVVSAWMPLRPPTVVGADAPNGEFSAARAFAQLESMASAPRPSGSAKHAEVRGEIIRRIEALGLAAEVQAETVVAEFAGETRVARVRNVLARLEGEQGAGTILAAAHYDSAPHSPGASDAGAGVVALLETLRALQAGPRPANDVIFLFSDAEEEGLLGAHAFQRYHPWAAEVDLVLNFEARGSRGPSIMFETGPGTGPLMGRFASFAPRPVASSFSDAVYRRLPNDTDFTVFKRAGTAGFNFAFIRDLAAYHTALDTPARLDRRSLQHHGDYALSLLRGFGDEDLESPTGGAPAVYFNVPFLGLATYPASWTLPLLAVALVLLALALRSALRSGRAPAGRIFAGGAAAALVTAGAGVAVYLVDLGLSAALMSGRGFLTSPPTYRLGLMLVAFAIAAGLSRWAVKMLGLLAASAGALLPWAVLAVVSALYLPAVSYLSIWPLVFASSTVWLLGQGEGERSRRSTAAAILLLAVPAAVLWVPATVLIGDALGALAGAALGTMVGLAVSAAIPQVVACVPERRGWLAPAFLFALGFGLCLVQALSAGYDAGRPRPTSLFYVLDADETSAWWATWDRRIDPWTRHFVGQNPELRSMEEILGWPFEAWIAPAPVAPLAAPRAVDPAVEAGGVEGEPARLEAPEASAGPAGEAPEETGTDGRGRTVRLRVESLRAAPRVFLELRSRSVIAGVSIDGRPLAVESEERPEGAPAGFWRTAVRGVGDHPLDLEVVLRGPDPLRVMVVDAVYELPEVPGFSFPPRPSELRPRSRVTTDASLVRRSFVF